MAIIRSLPPADWSSFFFNLSLLPVLEADDELEDDEEDDDCDELDDTDDDDDCDD